MAANSNVRIEWIKIEAVDTAPIFSVLGGAQNLSVNTSVTVNSSPAPIEMNTGCYGKVTAVDAAAVFLATNSIVTNLTEDLGVRLEAGETYLLKAQSGWQIQCIQSVLPSIQVAVSLSGNTGLTLSGNVNVISSALPNNSAIETGGNLTSIANTNANLVLISNNININTSNVATQVSLLIANNNLTLSNTVSIVTNTANIALIASQLVTNTNLILSNTASIVTNTANIAILLAKGQNTVAGSISVTLPSNPDYYPANGSITVVDVGTTSANGQSNVSIVTGTPTAGSFVTQTINGQAMLRLQVTGSFIGTINFESSIDGNTTFIPTSGKIGGTSYTTGTATANGVFLFDVSGMTNFRARCVQLTSGSANLVWSFTKNTGVVEITNPLKIFDNTTGSQVSIDGNRSLQTVIYDSFGNPISWTGDANTNIDRIGGTAVALGHGTASGALRVELPTDGTGIVGLISGTTVALTGNNIVVGPTASLSALTANPVTTGGMALLSNPTAASNGTVINAMFDKTGKQVVVGALRQLKGYTQTTITGSVANTIIAAGSTGIFNDLYGLTITNTSASNVSVIIGDGINNITTIAVPSNDTRGFMLPADSALPQNTAAHIWQATVNTAVTSVIIGAFYVQNI